MSKYADFVNVLSDNELKNVYLLSRRCTKDTQLIEFQFKTLHRYLPTNSLLFVMGKVASNKCTFCGLYSESIMHLLFECNDVRNLWYQIETTLQRIFHSPFSLTCFDVIFGYNVKKSESLPVNLIILYVKYFIWKQRCLLLMPNYGLLKAYVAKENLSKRS